MQQVIERYTNMVYGIALTHTANRTDADDVFQEVFLAYLRHTKKNEAAIGVEPNNQSGVSGESSSQDDSGKAVGYNGATGQNDGASSSSTQGFNSEEHRKAWLIKTTINCALKITQSSWNQRVRLDELSDDTSVTGVTGAVNTASYTNASTADAAEFHFRTDEQDAVFLALKALNEPYNTVLHLYYFEDLSIKSISDLLECQPGTIKTQLSRGRALLRDSLKDLKGGYFND